MGEDSNNSTVKSSNQNTIVQNMSNKPNQQQPYNPIADIIPCNLSDEQSTDAGKNLVNCIVGNLEKSSNPQSPRHSERLNPSQAQPSEQEP